MAVFDPEVLEELLWRFRARHISRREFLSALGTGGVVLTGSSLLAACGGSDQQITPAAGSTAAAQGASTTTTGSSTQAAGGATTAAGTTAPAAELGGTRLPLLSKAILPAWTRMQMSCVTVSRSFITCSITSECAITVQTRSAHGWPPNESPTATPSGT